MLKIDPGHWFAGAARARIDVLSLYEGSFAELAELDAVRRSPNADAAAIDALARTSKSWRGRVWADAQLFVAEAFVGRLHDPSRAVEPALAVARSDADPVQRGAAWDLAYAALRSDVARAEREIANDPRAPEPIRARVRREVRRRSLHRASTAIAGLGGGLSLFALGVAARRQRLSLVLTLLQNPIALAFVVVTPLMAGLLANAWDHGMGTAFFPFGFALALVHLLVSAWRGAFGDRALGVRVAGSVTAALCVVAAAYLVLERGEAYGVPLLEGFGL